METFTAFPAFSIFPPSETCWKTNSTQKNDPQGLKPALILRHLRHPSTALRAGFKVGPDTNTTFFNRFLEIQSALRNRSRRAAIRMVVYRASENLRKHGAAPHRGKPKDKAADGIESGQKERAASNGGKRFPFIG